MSTPANLLAQVQQYQSEQGQLPPVHLWNPPLCENVDMRIGRDGTWYYQNSPIGRKSMVKLFATLLRYDEDGEHYLVTPIEKIKLVVECAPFLVTSLESSGSGDQRVLVFGTLTDDRIVCGPDHRLWVENFPDTGDPLPLTHVRNGLNALIHRNVYYQLVDMGTPVQMQGERVLGVYSQGELFSLGSL